MNENTNETIQQQATPTPEETGGAGRMFTQEEVNKIVSDRLTREREKLAEGNEYKVQYEAVKKELEGMKAAQLRQAKESAYRALLVDTKISEKFIPLVMRASREEIDALELDEAGKIVGADKLMEAIKTDWADFVMVIKTYGANTPVPPACCYSQNDDKIASAFKPKI